MVDNPQQLSLFDTFKINSIPVLRTEENVEELAITTARKGGLRVSTIKWKSNRQVMASVGKSGVLNLHTIYKGADQLDFEALTKVLKGNAGGPDRQRFHEFIEQHLPNHMPNSPSRIKVLPPRGAFYDLEEIYSTINPLLLSKLDPDPIIGWSPARVGRTQVTWGTHRSTSDGPLVMVNQVLDDYDIPNYVVEHILWHEICHCLAPPSKGENGKRHIHTQEFKRLEKLYPRLHEAEKWENNNVGKIIRRHLRINRRNGNGQSR
jgi:hypothetical protein